MALQGSDTYNYSKTMWDFKAKHKLAWDLSKVFVIGHGLYGKLEN